MATRLLEAVTEHAREAGSGGWAWRRAPSRSSPRPGRCTPAHGFVECEPFADYLPDPLSVFMTREF